MGASKHQRVNNRQNAFCGEAQIPPAQAGARTAPHTTVNFTVIPKQNKAICSRSPFTLDNYEVVKYWR